jgi:hypothetical protein
MVTSGSKRPGWADSMIAVQKDLQSTLKIRGQKRKRLSYESNVKCNNSHSVTAKGTNDTQA